MKLCASCVTKGIVREIRKGAMDDVVSDDF